MAKPKSTTPSKSDQQPNPEAVREAWRRHEAEELAVNVSAVLKNPACPEKLFNAIGDALSEIQTGVDSMSADFLCGLFMAPQKEQEGTEI